MAFYNSIFAVLAIAIIACLSGFVSAEKINSPIHIGAVVFPEHGHFSPLTAILQACVDRGDSVTIYTPSFFIPASKGQSYGPEEVTAEEAASSNGAKKAGGTVRWVSLGDYSYATFDDSFFVRLVESPPIETLAEVNDNMAPFMAWMVRGLKQHFDANADDRPDVFLVDYGSNNAAFIGEYLKVPTVMSWPMTLTFPYSTNFNVPFMSFPFSAEATFIERWVNIIIYAAARATAGKAMEQPNLLRAELGLAPTDVYHMLDRNPVITPSIHGFEVSQPLCPNVFAVGRLLPAMNGTVDEGYTQWLENDCDRLVYINMGSVAVLPARWDGAILNASIALANGMNSKQRTCVVWKRRTIAESSASDFVSPQAQSRLRIVRHLPFSPRHLLKHSVPKVFVTHCGDTSVFESIEAHVPMVGIPLFADQPNVCARVKDANVGTFVEKNSLTKDALLTAVEAVFGQEKAIVARLRFLDRTAQSQGMSPRAAEVMHFIADLGFEGAKALNCKHIDEPWYRVYDIDVMVGMSVIMWTIILVCFYFIKCCCCRCCGCGCVGRKKKAAEKQKLE